MSTTTLDSHHVAGRAAPPRKTSRTQGKTTRRASESWLWFGVIASQVYYFHRYVFRYDDPGTSPTYGPTPAAWQIGKYLLIPAVGVAALIAHAAQHRGRIPAASSRGFATALFLITSWCILLTLAAAALSPQGVNELPKFWFFLPLTMTLALSWEGRRSLDRGIRVVALLVLYNVAFSAWEMYNFYTVGRLPALAYPNGGLVRFGGALDDPNGLAIFLVLPILGLLAGWPVRMSGRRRIVWLVVLLFLLVKSVSYTGAAGLLIGAIAFVFIGRQLTRGAVVALALLSGALLVVLSGIADNIIKLKAASAASRLEFSSSAGSTNGESVSSFFHHVSPWGLMFGNPQLTAHTETSYLQLAMQFGLPLATAVSCLILISIRQGIQRAHFLRQAGFDQESRLWAALTAYVIAFAVAALGVPLLSVFPVNLLFWIVTLILWLPYEPTGDVRRGDGKAVAMGRKHLVSRAAKPSRVT